MKAKSVLQQIKSVLIDDKHAICKPLFTHFILEKLSSSVDDIWIDVYTYRNDMSSCHRSLKYVIVLIMKQNSIDSGAMQAQMSFLFGGSLYQA